MGVAIQVVLLSMIVVASILAVRFKDLLSSIVALASVSLLLSLEFYILQAPDVAIAEAAIAAALTTAIFVLTIMRTRRKEEER
jgi:uncharacterized MnhB-related membrane protein